MVNIIRSVSKKMQIGKGPAIALCNPKYPRNVGQIIRVASCFDIKQVWFSGNRVSLEPGTRLPREERMKGYDDVDLIQFDYFFDQFPKNVVPVAVEVVENAEMLTHFVHPENALYVFGPEDGHIPQVMRQHCQRFCILPTKHCLNLAHAVSLVMYDRQHKQYMDGVKPVPSPADVLDEPRGWAKFEELTGVDYDPNQPRLTLDEMVPE